MSKDHLAAARSYIEKGDEYYAKAADEIIVAQKADPTLSDREIGERIGKSKDWVRRLVRARTSGSRAIDWESGSNKRDEVASTVLKNPEQRREVLAALPKRELEQVAIEAADEVREREASTPRVSRSTTPLDEITAEVEILSHIHRAVRTAQRHGKERFLVKRLRALIDRLEMEEAAASPKEAVAELEQWLAEQV